MGDDSTSPLPNFNGATLEVLEWKGDFIPNFTGHVITYPWPDLILNMLVKGGPKIWSELRLPNVASLAINNFSGASVEHQRPWNSLGRYVLNRPKLAITEYNNTWSACMSWYVSYRNTDVDTVILPQILLRSHSLHYPQAIKNKIKPRPAMQGFSGTIQLVIMERWINLIVTLGMI